MTRSGFPVKEANMTRRIVLIVVLCLMAALGLSAPGKAQTASNYVPEVPPDTTGPIGVDETGDKQAIPWPAGFPFPVPPLDPRVVWTARWICRNASPAEVTGFRVQCPNATFLDFHIADCCLPGDHWQLKGKAWDANPNTAVTTSPGPVPVYSVPGRVYRYAGTPFTRSVDAYVECSYLHGVRVFLADSYVHFSSDAACTVTPDPGIRRIDRTP